MLAAGPFRGALCGSWGTSRRFLQVKNKVGGVVGSLACCPSF